MRTPPHLPGPARPDTRDDSRDALRHSPPRPRRHPYALREFPVQSPQPEMIPAPDLFAEQRLLEIRDMSHQAIGSIDDLLQHTA
ncbi:hypothetical protein Nocox_18195 [Nonomuraea coxensis DSM 45129]|uniref:Uncharacterized protein n=1 Tax=Nonomuraea coxensis DSM 45129 TaxID=1122611 RepID=A0ABX8U3M4_9ACTN|nr:hypothetical protein [Nonomuraea coxensis]QYC41248.1 hypothetical protein Nocox_18195 [Nonomuraea coxensis DSM 45129]